LLAKAKADLERIQPLAAMGAASAADLDGATAQHEAAIGALQAARARVKQAQIQLGYAWISAPISGLIGITKANVGEFVGRSPNPVVLNFVSLIDPIRVRFAIDERTYLRLARKFRAMESSQRARLQDSDAYELILADGSLHEYRGRSVARDAAIDPATGTFTLEADFPNPEKLVLAGQFARVRVEIDRRTDALLIPQRAISELQGIFQVFVVDEEGGVHLRGVELGPKIDRLRIIEKGLAPGDRVAVEVARLKQGMTVVPKPVQLAEDGSIIKQPAAADAQTTED
jgi:membrane fusion protein (multidrug efflux system)